MEDYLMAPPPYGAPPPGYGYAPAAPPGYAQPYGAPAPPPMPPPVMLNKTKDGIKYMSYFLILSIIVHLISALIAFVAFADPTAVISLGCLVGGLGFLMLILFIVAMISLWAGKDEYGPEHAKNIKMAVVFFIIIIVMTIVSAALIVIFAMSAVMGAITLDAEQVAFNLMMTILVPAVLNLVTAILWGLILYMIPKHFMAPEEKTKSLLGVIFYAVGSVVNLAIAAMVWVGTLDLIIGAGELVTNTGTIITMIGDLFFFMVFKGVLMRFDTGQIQPPGAAPPAMGPPPHPGHAPPPQAPPPQQPGYAPPPQQPGYAPPPQQPGYGPPPQQPGYGPPPQQPPY